jgi:hypothetical protein
MLGETFTLTSKFIQEYTRIGLNRKDQMETGGMIPKLIAVMS